MAERCSQATRGGITDGAGSSVGRVRAGSQLLRKRLVQRVNLRDRLRVGLAHRYLVFVIPFTGRMRTSLMR